MSHEFDGLDATEKAGLEAALNRCRVCRYCWNAIYASQVCDRYRRPVLQARRLQAFLKLKAGMWQSNPRSSSNPH
jgi:hypothetical protein